MVIQRTVLAMSISALLVACASGGAPDIQGKIETAPPSSSSNTGSSSTPPPASSTPTTKESFLQYLDNDTPIKYMTGYQMGKEEILSEGSFKPKDKDKDVELTLFGGDVILAKVSQKPSDSTDAPDQYFVYADHPNPPPNSNSPIYYGGTGYVVINKKDTPVLLHATYNPTEKIVTGYLSTQYGDDKKADSAIYIHFDNTDVDFTGFFKENKAKAIVKNSNSSPINKTVTVQGAFFGSYMGGLVSDPNTKDPKEKLGGIFAGSGAVLPEKGDPNFFTPLSDQLKDQKISFSKGYKIQGFNEAFQNQPKPPEEVSPPAEKQPADLQLMAVGKDIILAQVTYGQSPMPIKTAYEVYGRAQAQLPSEGLTQYVGKGVINLQGGQTIPTLFLATYDAKEKIMQGSLESDRIDIKFKPLPVDNSGQFQGDATISKSTDDHPEWKDKAIDVKGSFFGATGVGGQLSADHEDAGNMDVHHNISGVFAGEKAATAIIPKKPE